jgi:YD repeat-containing protein
VTPIGLLVLGAPLALARPFPVGAEAEARATAGAAASATADPAAPLVIDLLDAGPEDLGELPGIMEPEQEALAEAAGYGPESLRERLVQTGITAERLREWAPYLSLPESAGGAAAWRVRAVANGGGPTGGIGSSMRATVGGGSVRGIGAVITRPGDPRPIARGAILGDQSGIEYTLGSIVCGIPGGDPSEDPLPSSGSRSATVSFPTVGARERSGRMGVVLGRGGVRIGLSRSPGDGTGFAASIRNFGSGDRRRESGFAVAGREGGLGIAMISATRGAGIRIGVSLPDALPRMAGRAARASPRDHVPPAVVLDLASAGERKGRLRLATSIGSRSDGRQHRVDWNALGRFGGVRWAAGAQAASGTRATTPAAGAAAGSAAAATGASRLREFRSYLALSGRPGDVCDAVLAASWNRVAAASIRLERVFSATAGRTFRLAGQATWRECDGARPGVVKLAAGYGRGPIRIDCATAKRGCAWRLSLEQRGNERRAATGNDVPAAIHRREK